jgi:putative ATP-binding cassette transporter
MKGIFKIVLPMVGVGRFAFYVLLGILSGAFSFGFINFVTWLIGLLMAGELKSINFTYVFLSVSVIAGFILVNRTLAMAVIKLSQKLFWRLRKEILSSVLSADYHQLSSRKVRISSALLKDVYTLTEASMSIIHFFTSLILGVACLIYLASLSGILFIITLAVAFLGIIVYNVSSTRNNLAFEKSRLLENKFYESINEILNGFKEIFIEPKKGRYLYDNKIESISRDGYKNNTVANIGFLNNQITGQVLFYMLIFSVLLVFSIVLNIKAGAIVSFVFTLLYLLNAIETIMVSLPSLMRARVAATHLLDLKSDLEVATSNNRLPIKLIDKREFREMKIVDLEFYYTDNSAGFGIGPINLNIERGEIVFIYGGNGSGKTTFIYSLLGLRIPTGGHLFLNDNIIDGDNYADYRTVFAAVFSDFYLFNELIGIANLNLKKWDYYLSLFELDGHVKLEGNHFSTTELSTGQRKRLALVAALMEEKPVLVLDEWAADQDPYFREKFYTVILPLLKEEELTIIAITHDDKYYHCADKLFKMEYGKLSRENVNVYRTECIA